MISILKPMGFVSSLLIVLAASSASAQKPPAGRVVMLDRVIAVVNNEAITRRNLDDQIKILIANLRRQGAPSPSPAELEKQVLERMIFGQVQLQYAKETGLRVDDGMLDAAVNRIAENQKMSLSTLREVVERDGMSFAAFREEVRNEMLLLRLREREVDSRISISESEVDNLLNTIKNQAGGNEEFNLAHILIRVPEQASPEQLRERRARAEQALAQLKNGVDFRQVAVTYSDAPDAVQGGAMGWRELGRLPSIFGEAVQALKPGEVSAILRSANGFHIVRVNDRRGHNAVALVTQTRARHILIKSGDLVSVGDARDRLARLKERLDNKSDFAELARLQSEDGSASRGGDLGWLSPGDTVPEFERAMDALKPGQISEPVRTQFGWHLIEVLERRNQDVSQQQQRLQARQALRAQKSDESYQEWVRQLRDKAFIEYRLEER